MGDLSVIESHKENIQPLPGGRSVAGLVSTFNSGNTFKQREDLNHQRQAFEDQLQGLDELDDPIQVFIDYINWCHEKYPQGNNLESGLLGVLEKCTSAFKDCLHYKNDPRYLKTWLEYGKYSDSPVDIFVYLAKKEIGRELALYYEEFAKLLELNQKYQDAKEVYEIGISSNARPISRLKKSLSHFEGRKSAHQEDKSDSSIKRVLTLKRGTNPVEPQTINPINPNKKGKFEVFSEDTESAMPKSLFGEKHDSKDIGSVQLRKKENIINAKPWDGEVLFQQRPKLKDSDSSTKIPVFRDIEIPPEDVTQQNLHISEDNKVTTIITRPGKLPECINANMELFYPQDLPERSMAEILMLSRKMTPVENIDDSELPTMINETSEYPLNNRKETFTIPLKDDDSTLPSRNAPRSPTITFYSRMANNEVIDMFNSASKVDDDNDNDDEKSEGGSTNYDGFVTETIYQDPKNESITDPRPNVLENDENDQIPTQVDGDGVQEEPLSASSQKQIIDPLLEKLRDSLLASLSPPIESYRGYHNTKTQFIEAIRKFRSLTDKETKKVAKGAQGSIVNFCGDEIYSLKYELGQGGYGYVYLIENELGDLKALKAESKSSSWEFYILNQIHTRLKEDEYTRSRVIKPESLFLYKDECFLILNYLNQGTVLDVVNYYRNKGESVDELLCIFITIELLKVVEQLHTIGIIHGDLKADNCMISFKNTKDLEHMGDAHWNNVKIIMIDFGRSIDLTLFPEHTEFSTSFNTDQQDCPQMNNNQPWSYEADYYGIAAVVHTILFGEYIKIVQLPNGKYKLAKPLKRYWQTQMWGPLFDVLINPYYNNPEIQPKYPLIDELKYQRYKLESWLSQHDSRLVQMLREIEFDFRKFINI